MKKILVVDDDGFIRDIIVKTLAAEGYEVDQAADGQKAIDRLQSNNYDLVVTDVVMPHKSGISLSNYIHDNEIPTPVLAISGLSGKNDGPDVLEFAQYFADEHLVKPFQKGELLETVRRLLDAASARKNSGKA